MKTFKRIFCIVIALLMCTLSLCGCGIIDRFFKKNSTGLLGEIWKSNGVAFLTEDGAYGYLKDTNGKAEPAFLPGPGGSFGNTYTNSPADSGQASPSASFSKDGKNFYYFTDIENGIGVLRRAAVDKLEPGDGNEQLTDKLVTEIEPPVIVTDAGTLFAAYKNGKQKIYLHDGENTSELVSDDMSRATFSKDFGKFFYVTPDGTAKYVDLKSKSEHTVAENVSYIWYDGGDVIFCTFVPEENAEAVSPSTDNSVPAATADTYDPYGAYDKYDYDRTATDESRSGYDENVMQITAVGLDGKVKKTANDVYAPLAIINSKFYYAKKYTDHIRLSNLVKNIEKADRETLYTLDHEYLDDVRYELWCFDGNKSVKVSDDLYYKDSSYDEADYYSAYASAMNGLIYKTGYLVSDEFFEKFAEPLILEAYFCHKYDLRDLDELKTTVRSAYDKFGYFNSDSGNSTLVSDYIRYVNDNMNVIKNKLLSSVFSYGGGAVVYSKALKSVVEPFDYNDAEIVSVIANGELKAYYFLQRCGMARTNNVKHILTADGKDTTVPCEYGSDSFVGALNGGKAFAFKNTALNTLTVRDGGGKELLSEEAGNVTFNEGKLYYYNGGDLICFDGKTRTVLAQDVSTDSYTAWIYDDLTLAMSSIDGNDGTLRIYKKGEGEWISDDVSYFQRINKKEMIYISDNTLYAYDFSAKKAVRLADGVVRAYGAYYGGVLMGYNSVL